MCYDVLAVAYPDSWAKLDQELKKWLRSVPQDKPCSCKEYFQNAIAALERDINECDTRIRGSNGSSAKDRWRDRKRSYEKWIGQLCEMAKKPPKRYRSIDAL
jgi:hypothetical protein